MTGRLALCAIALTVACASLPDAGNSVVALELTSPVADTLFEGTSQTLTARALNLQGDPVPDAVIYWRTADTALVALDSVRGIITAKRSTGSARLQARVGTLTSDFLIVTLAPVPDTTTTSSSIRRP